MAVVAEVWFSPPNRVEAESQGFGTGTKMPLPTAVFVTLGEAVQSSNTTGNDVLRGHSSVCSNALARLERSAPELIEELPTKLLW